MKKYRISELFDYEKGSLQSTKSIEGEYNFLTAAQEWKSHNTFTHDTEALVCAAAASGSLGRTHYINEKFIASDLCFIVTPTADSDRPTNVHVTVFDPFDSARDTCCQGIWSLYDGTRFKWAGNALTYMTSESITGFTFYTDSGNFESHSIMTVWGLKS